MSGAAFGFLRTLYPEGIAPHRLLVWTMTGGTKRSHWFQNIEAAVEFVTDCDADAVYFGVGLAPKDFGPHARCKADEVAALPGLVCDFDIFGVVHNKAGLPPTIEEALRIFPAQFPPSIVWETGHGIQGAWLFKELWGLTSQDECARAAALSQRWHNYLAGEAKRLGYAIDAVHDLSRVLRLPGSRNRKIADDPRLVQVIRESGERYDPTDLENILDTFGVPEIEVKNADEQGRVEYGQLNVSPRVELGPELEGKLKALLVNDPDFGKAWNREKRMPRDNSWSGYAQSITNMLAVVGFSDQEIIDILSVHRREQGDSGKQTPKPLSWFAVTIGKARTWAKEHQDRDSRRREREARQREAEQRESIERVLIAEVCTGEPEAQRVLKDLLDLDVRRLVQIGNDIEPGYRLELVDGRIATIPSLAAMTSFAAFNRYIWRYLRTALPANAKRQWRAVSIALAKLIVVEDTGLSGVEVLISDLGHYFSQYGTFFEAFPACEFPDGPPADKYSPGYPFNGLLRAESDDEFCVGLRLLARPQKHQRSLCGVYFLDQTARSDVGGEVARVLFKLPPLYDWLRKQCERKYETEELTRRLNAAGFEYRETASECGVRLKRIWRGTLADGAVDEHSFLLLDERAALEYKCGRATGAVK